MYQTKSIHYKTIFKQDGQTETIEYKAKGILSLGDKCHLNFSVEGMTIDITYDKYGICLSHGNSKLNFDYKKEVWNQYVLPYGTVDLKTKLLKFEANEEHIKMKYELYDHGGIISTAYIYVTMIPYHFTEEMSEI